MFLFDIRERRVERMERSKANTLGVPNRKGASGGGYRKGAKSRRLPAFRPTASVLKLVVLFEETRI